MSGVGGMQLGGERGVALLERWTKSPNRQRQVTGGCTANFGGGLGCWG